MATSHSNRFSSLTSFTRKPSTGSSRIPLYSRARALSALLVGCSAIRVETLSTPQDILSQHQNLLKYNQWHMNRLKAPNYITISTTYPWSQYMYPQNAFPMDLWLHKPWTFGFIYLGIGLSLGFEQAFRTKSPEDSRQIIFWKFSHVAWSHQRKLEML